MSARKTEKYRFFQDHHHELKQGLKDLKVIYSDLDGTLCNDQGCIIRDEQEDYYFEAVRLLETIKGKDLDLVLVSGRNKFSLRYIAQMIGVQNYIAELGSELVYGLGREVHVTFDEGNGGFDLTYDSNDLNQIMAVIMQEFPGKIESRTEWSRHRSYNALFLGEIDLKRANQLLTERGYKGLEFVDNGFSRLVDLDLDVERLHIYNLMPAGVTKANGVSLDKKIRGFDRENCIALGDSLEDLKMAPEVKYFFLMKNALDHREELDDELPKYDNVYITGKLMNHGWNEVMRALL